MQCFFRTDSSGSIIQGERSPSDVLSNLIQSSYDIVEPFLPYVKHKKLENLNSIFEKLDRLEGGLTSYWLEKSKLKEINVYYHLKDEFKFVNQITEIKKYLDKL
jgi:hypothetical protein